MALIIKKDGRVLCAAIHPSYEDGDIYIDDVIQYQLSVIAKVLVTEPHDKHKLHGEWWWVNNIPEGIKIDEFYRR